MNLEQPSVLYKYRDDSLRTEEILTKGMVWLATADHLNDPLECKTGKVSETWKRDAIRDMKNGQMSGFIMSAIPSLEGKEPFYSLSHRAAKKWFKRLKKLDNTKKKYTAIRSFLKDHGRELSGPAKLFDSFEKQLSRVGVFSLSECPVNQLMWAHYGANHTGLVIGFSSAESKLASSANTLKVVYDNQKPVFSGGFIDKIAVYATAGGGQKSEQSIGFSDKTYRAAFSTKPLEWSYEKEWRYVEEQGGLYPWPGPIVTVVFGLRMPHDRRKRYVEIISSVVKYPVEFKEIIMTPDFSAFEMTPWLETK